jgi:hypothetical protein
VPGRHATNINAKISDFIESDDGGSALFTSIVTALLAVGFALSAWLIVTNGVPHVSAAASAEEPEITVPYFPAQYVNQAGEPMPMPPTF